MVLKIYFCGSIRAGRDDMPLYAKIIDHLKKYGSVLTEHVGYPDLEESEHSENEEDYDKRIHDRDVKWLTEADVLIAEVTQPSLGVGYEIGRAAAMKKPCLFLFRPESGYKLSAMISGLHDGQNFILKRYSEPEVFHIVDSYITNLKISTESTN